MRIADIRATPVTVPLEAPLRHANGCHWGRFVRTIVEVETDDGLVGLGEMGGGGESATAAFHGLKPYLVGRDPARIEEMRFLIANPTASLYNNRTQIVAALEFACLDLLGQKWGVPVCEILGGRLRDRVPFASYLFFRYPRAEYQGGEVRTAEQLVAQARALKKEHGFTSHKLKGGVFPPEYELECYRALAAALPGDRFRFDPNGVWSAEQAIWFGQQIEGIRNDYLEDPVYGLHGMRRVREKVRMPLATNTVVVNFEQLVGQRARHGGGRHPARHDLLGRDPALREGGRHLRDVPARRGRPLLRRARDPARHDAAHGRGRSRTSASPPTRTTTT